MSSPSDSAPSFEGGPCHRQEEILDAATELFAELGYTEAVTQDLALKLQVGKGTIYRFYPSKRDLFLAAVDRVMWRLRARIDAATRDDLDPLDRVEDSIRAILGFFEDHPNYVELLVQERALFKDRTTPTYLAHHERHRERWHDIYRQLMAEGRVRPMPPERISTVFLDLVYGTIFTNHFSGWRRSADDQARDVIDILFRGILAEPERARRDPAAVEALSAPEYAS